MLNTIAKHVVPEWYLATSAGQSALRKEQTRRRADRQELVEQRSALLRRRPKMRVQHDQAIEPLRVAAVAAEGKPRRRPPRFAPRNSDGKVTSIKARPRPGRSSANSSPPPTRESTPRAAR